MVYKRSRILYLFLIIVTISAGLTSRYFSDALPSRISNYAGDTLWALMVFLIFAFIFSSWPTLKIGVCGIMFSFTIEASQLYHAQWIESIRSTRLGGLVLGFGFLWSDLVCYCLGIGVGILFEKAVIRNKVIKKG